MEYDPNEMFREDPGEMELSPEFNAEMQLQQEAAQLEDTQLDETSTPTGEQPQPAQTPTPSTEEVIQDGVEFDPSKDFSYYAAQGMSRS